MAKDIKIRTQSRLKPQPKKNPKNSVQNNLNKGLQQLGKELSTKKIPAGVTAQKKDPKVSKQETRNILPASPAEPEPEQVNQNSNLPQIGQTWIEKVGTGKNGKKIRCYIVLSVSDGQEGFVLMMSRTAYDKGGVTPTQSQSLKSFMKTWRLMQ